MTRDLGRLGGIHARASMIHGNTERVYVRSGEWRRFDFPGIIQWMEDGDKDEDEDREEDKDKDKER